MSVQGIKNTKLGKISQAKAHKSAFMARLKITIMKIQKV